MKRKPWGALNHPNIVTLHSVDFCDDQLFITMELVRGAVLADRIPREGMRVTPFLDLAIPLADALAAAHGSGVVHRDLKPHNIMVSEDGRVKVLDFGLARADALIDQSGSELTHRLTQEGHVVGTFAYMAPEQAEGRRVETRSDIFSLGAVFYQMLAGAPPFKGGTAVSTLAAVIKDDPRRLSDLRHDRPRDLSRLVTRCLAKDPNRRYQNVADLRTDLEDLKLDLSAGVIEASVARKARPKPRIGNWTASLSCWRWRLRRASWVIERGSWRRPRGRPSMEASCVSRLARARSCSPACLRTASSLPTRASRQGTGTSTCNALAASAPSTSRRIPTARIANRRSHLTAGRSRFGPSATGAGFS